MYITAVEYSSYAWRGFVVIVSMYICHVQLTNYLLTYLLNFIQLEEKITLY